eukprot:742153-Pelagomonas_calceolata.AAC.1
MGTSGAVVPAGAAAAAAEVEGIEAAAAAAAAGDSSLAWPAWPGQNNVKLIRLGLELKGIYSLTNKIVIQPEQNVYFSSGCSK